MLNLDEIDRIVVGIAQANLKPEIVDRVLTEPAIDSEGHEALRITIVIAPDAADRLRGDAVRDTLVEIQDQLREAGEELFPIVEYATQAELESGNTES